MAAFPQLKTGSVAQYPARKTICYSTTVMRFVDGSEQRFREYTAPLRRWIIDLDLLDDSELAALESFFQSQQGRLNDFSFTDPWDDTEYSSCRLEEDGAAVVQHEVGRGRIRLVVRENRS